MENEKDIKYYRFPNGTIFAYNQKTLNFYIQNVDGTWSLEPRLISIFYDAASDYEEIVEEKNTKGI